MVHSPDSSRSSQPARRRYCRQAAPISWTLASQTGFTFASLPWQPRIALSTNIASGDTDPDDADLGTFNPLYPRGNYFSEDAVLGPRNSSTSTRSSRCSRPGRGRSPRT